MTLVEAVIATALLALVAGGLYAGGIMSRKLAVYNGLSVEAKGLAVEKLEEIVSGGVQDIVVLAPYGAQTNVVRQGREIVRTIDVVGHDAYGGVDSNLAGSAYVELHVHSTFTSPISGRSVTNSLTTIVR